jgi:hypothetical protein
MRLRVMELPRRTVEGAGARACLCFTGRVELPGVDPEG